MIRNIITIVLAALLVCGCKLTTRNTNILDDFIPIIVPAERVANYQRDLVYASPGGRDILLDVSWPEGEGPFPVLVWVHGGNYNHFSKESGEALARYITNRGYVVVNINYRMVPEVHLKEITLDVMAAVIWTKVHAAEYHGDPARVALAGHSAGAHLAELVALACRDPYFTPPRAGPGAVDACPAAVIPVSGYFEFEPEWNDWNTWLVGVPRPDDPQLYAKCEPAAYDLSGLPPHLIVFGENDMHRARGEAWAEKLAAAAVPVQTFMAPGADHHWIMWHWKKPTKQTYQRMVDFLDETFNTAGAAPPE